MQLEKIVVWYSVGSSILYWFLTEAEAVNIGYITGSVETYVGSDIHTEAVKHAECYNPDEDDLDN